MNTKLLGAFCLIQFVCSSNGPAIAEKHEHFCQDMSEHQEVLDQGMKLHGASRAGSSFMFPREFLPDRVSRASRYDMMPPGKAVERANLVAWRTTHAKSLRIEKQYERLDAARHAVQSEELGMYPPAIIMYGRLLNAQNSNLESSERIKLTQGLERAKLCQLAQELQSKKRIS